MEEEECILPGEGEFGCAFLCSGRKCTISKRFILGCETYSGYMIGVLGPGISDVMLAKVSHYVATEIMCV